MAIPNATGTLIENNKKIKTYDVDKMWGIGVPEDLNYFKCLIVYTLTFETLLSGCKISKKSWSLIFLVISQIV